MREESPGILILETWSVDQPHDFVESRKFDIGGGESQRKTWTGMLHNIVKASGGEHRGGEIEGVYYIEAGRGGFFRDMGISADFTK